jgi:hypothetical protein
MPAKVSRDVGRILHSLGADVWSQTIRVAAKGGGPTDVTRASRESVAHILDQLNDSLEGLIRPVRDAMQQLLAALEGKSFGSLEANQAVTRRVQQLIERLGMRVACPKTGCGEPALLRCAAAGNSTHGVFQFDHSVAGKRTTHLGSSLFPPVRLVDAPTDRRRRPT